ncbi:hypothetical protein BT63DRAFT_460270 [Microthyrium microscopicum]|uniref:F-box domain-containing protein n=1 Tax=Microthyrium microscopicum TaxID=703497 RepID=A0A6A6TYJ8_9PEZI|nr:hypothetical protein BT63DRAFT_460270 [Microthyrium microscopicum]
MSLLNIPPELITMVARELKGEDLKSLRLVCKYLTPLATEILFAKLRIIPVPNGGPENHVLQTTADRLCSLIREIVILSYTEELYLGTRAAIYASMPREDDPEGIDHLPDEWKMAVQQTKVFTNLDSIYVKFDGEIFDDPDLDPEMPPDYHWVERHNWLQYKAMCFVSAAVPMFKAQGTPIRSLTFANMQCNIDRLDSGSSRFADLKELHISACHKGLKQGHPKATHSFWPGLTEVWLSPLASQLTHLTLYCTGYWGVIPAWKPGNLHFPNLKYLALGRYTFAHESQVDWILQQKTLRHLSLDNCIIAQYLVGDPDFPFRDVIDVAGLESFDCVCSHNPDKVVQTIFECKLRWCQIFVKLCGLKKLAEFNLGIGNWEKGQAFEERYLLGLWLPFQRYATIIYKQWIVYSDPISAIFPEKSQGIRLKHECPENEYFYPEGLFADDMDWPHSWNGWNPPVGDPGAVKREVDALRALYRGLRIS